MGAALVVVLLRGGELAEDAPLKSGLGTRARVRGEIGTSVGSSRTPGTQSSSSLNTQPIALHRWAQMMPTG